MYFKSFPTIPYDSTGTGDFKDVKNLLRRVAVRQQVKTNALLYDTYDVKEGMIFLLWGAFAQKKSALIDTNKHHILTTTHPSPFSAYRGFLGCNHFSKTNKILLNSNQKPINWKLCSEPLTLF